MITKELAEINIPTNIRQYSLGQKYLYFPVNIYKNIIDENNIVLLSGIVRPKYILGKYI